MKTVLCINSSARIERSHTRYLTNLFVKEWRSLRPEDRFISRDIGTRPPPPVTESWIAAAFTPAPKRTSAMRDVLRVSDTLIDELVQTDLILLGAPMYNFGMPAQLKAYVDQIVRVARTFALDVTNEKQPYKPLLTGKRMLVITSTGDAGYHPGGPLEQMNHLDPHIRTAFGFIGITDIDFIGVNYDEFPDDRVERSLAGAETALRRWLRNAVNADIANNADSGTSGSAFAKEGISRQDAKTLSF
jgi:FMN-dependent NADH-azoreductase